MVCDVWCMMCDVWCMMCVGWCVMCVVLCCVVVLCGEWCAVVFCSFRSRRRCAIQNEDPISRSIGKNLSNPKNILKIVRFPKSQNTIWSNLNEHWSDLNGKIMEPTQKFARNLKITSKNHETNVLKSRFFWSVQI